MDYQGLFCSLEKLPKNWFPATTLTLGESIHLPFKLENNKRLIYDISRERPKKSCFCCVCFV